MNKFKFISLLSAVVISAVSLTACGEKTQVSTPDANKLPSAIENYADDPEIAKNKSETTLGKPVTINDTVYTLNNVIDAGIVLDNLRYYYLDITVKNTSDKDFLSTDSTTSTSFFPMALRFFQMSVLTFTQSSHLLSIRSSSTLKPVLNTTVM